MSEMMTAEQAASKLTNIMHDDLYSWSPTVLTAFGMAVDALRGLPSAQPSFPQVHENDCISRVAVIDAFLTELTKRERKNLLHTWSTVEVKYFITDMLEKLPSAQPEQDREFIKLTVRNSNGRPYYSIIYLEIDDNGVGHDFEGYSSYSLDVISDYLKKHFMPSTQPEPCEDALGVNLHVVKISKHCSDFSDLDNVKECEDAVSRQAAADVVDFECGEWRGLAKTIINKLEALPSAQPEQRWIPCGKCIHADGKHRWCKVLDRSVNEDYFCYWAEPWKEGEAK